MPQPHSILISPIVTEKTVATPGKYTFSIHSRATKKDVAQAVNNFYGVKVVKVNISTLPPKKRLVNRGKATQKRPKVKKATVMLEEGKKLDFNTFK